MVIPAQGSANKLLAAGTNLLTSSSRTIAAGTNLLTSSSRTIAAASSLTRTSKARSTLSTHEASLQCAMMEPSDAGGSDSIKPINSGSNSIAFGSHISNSLSIAENDTAAFIEHIAAITSLEQRLNTVKFMNARMAVIDPTSNSLILVRFSKVWVEWLK